MNTVPTGQTFVHPYGTRTIHRVATGNAKRGERTACDKHTIGAIDEVRPEGSYIPARWDSWRNCPACFRD